MRDQVDGALYEYHNVPATSPAAWLAEHAAEGARIGYDAWLHGRHWAQATAKALEAKGAALVAVERNPVDTVWADRPAPSLAHAFPHPDDLAGVPSEAKRSAVAEGLAAQGADAAVISALDSLAWLLNIRGEDVARTPVALSFLIAHADGTADLFIAPEKVTPALTAHLGNAVRIAPREAFEPALATLAGRKVVVAVSYTHLDVYKRQGYNTAAKWIERMENDGLVGPANHVGRREVYRDKDGSPL